MANGKLHLITPPENLFNFNPSYLLVKPSPDIKMQVKNFLSNCEDDVNVYIFDGEDTDIQWMLACSRMSDIIVIDVDHCDEITKNFISFMLIHPKSFYITADDDSPWSLISRNRIYSITDIIDHLNPNDEEYDEEDDEE